MELLVGPIAPRHPCLPGTPSPRYTPAMFTIPTPQYLPKQRELHHLTGSKDPSLVRKQLDEALEPLPAFSEGDGHILNFFGQAIFLGLGMWATSIIGIGAGGLWFALKRYRSI